MTAASNTPGPYRVPIANSSGVLDNAWLTPSLASLATQNLPAIYAPNLIQPRFARFVGFGDSITAGGHYLWNQEPHPSNLVLYHNWHWIAQLYSDSRAVFAGNFGFGGMHIQELKDIYLPYLLAASPRPSICVVLMGQNDLGQITPEILTNYTYVIDQMIAAGVTPILCTLTPGAITKDFHRLNNHIRYLAILRHLHICDLTAALTDPTTGYWIPAYTSDGVHPSGPGAKVMGQKLADTLIELIPHNSWKAFLPRSNAGYNTSRLTGTGGTDNPLMLSDNGGTPAFPTGWGGILQGGHAGAHALTTPGGDIAGRALTLTRGAGLDLIARLYLAGGDSPGVLAGDKYLIGFRVSASVESVGGQWGFALMSTDTGPNVLYDVGRGSGSPRYHDSAPHVFFMEVTIPANDSSLLIDFIVTGAEGASMTISEICALNLTGLGVTIA